MFYSIYKVLSYISYNICGLFWGGFYVILYYEWIRESLWNEDF